MVPSEGSPDRDHKPSRKGIGGVYREYGPFLTLGIQLAAAVVVFLALGIWADSRFETSPLFTLLGLLLGSIGGFIKFFRTISELEKKDRSSSRDGVA
jgi:F0F1-type ATP synthase assembly protein I